MDRRRQSSVCGLFLLVLGCDAEDNTHRLLDDHFDARPSTLPAEAAPSPGTITPVVFIPAGEDVPESEMQRIAAALADLEAWYDGQLGDMHLRIGATQVVYGEQDANWYLTDQNIWKYGPDELKKTLGYSPWDDGHIVLLMGRGLLGWAGGAGNSNAGFAVVGLESLVDNAACSPEWWCNPEMWRGTAIHELGHALTLGHSEPPSIMDFHGDWRNKVLLDNSDWEEVRVVRGLRFSDLDAVTPDPGPGEPEPEPGPGVDEGCGDLSYAGRCEGTTLVWCEDGSERSYDCANANMSCGWQDDVVGNNCLAARGECGDVDYQGRCDGATLVWCEGGGLRSYNCENAGMRCGWQDDAVGNNCL